MTKEEFIAYYCGNSGLHGREYFDKYLVALPCYCGDESCQGWASISNEPACIEEHMRRDGYPRSGSAEPIKGD